MAASQHGLILRGGFAVTSDDDIPPVNNRPAKHLLLFGNTGSSMWDAFSCSGEYRDNLSNPLNRWSERIGNEIAGEFSALALFPFGGPPHRPFLIWGKKAEALRNSQIGILMHPQFGLWHSYRFALAFADEQNQNAQTDDAAAQTEHTNTNANICADCQTKPCLHACPVNAFTASGYDVQACFRYLESHSDSKCMREGCQARVACPQGAGYRYQTEHAAFHMRAFVVAMAEHEFPDDVHRRTDGSGAWTR